MSATLTAPEPQITTEQQQDEAPQQPSAGSPRMALLQTIRTIAWIGLLTGYFEVAVCLGRAFFRGHFLKMDVQFVWMTPLGEALVFLIAGLPLLVLSRFLARKTLTWIIICLMSFCGLFCAFRIVGGLHIIAILILALGLALKAAHFAETHLDGFERFVRRTFPWMVGAVILTAASMIGFRAYEERSNYLQLPPAADNAPNVLLIVMDTVRADALSVYSEQGIATPHLDTLARQGVTFDATLSTSSWTYPAHASMFTGHYPNSLSADWNTPMTEEHPTLAEALRRGGYETAGFVANTDYCGRPTGLDQGFVHYEDFQTNLRQVISHSRLFNVFNKTYGGLSLVGIYDNLPRKGARKVSDDFLYWLDRRPQKRPFFAFLNLLDAHSPYLPQRLVDEDREMTREEKLFMKNWDFVIPSQVDEELKQLARSAYRSTIHEMDAHLGRLFEELDRRGLRENTIIIVTSDHGELFGEHGTYYHGNNLYRPVVHVPLMISWPGQIPVSRVTTAVSLRDLAATVLDLTQMQDQLRLPGHSLRVTWDPDVNSDEGISLPYAMSSVHPHFETRALFSESPCSNGSLHALLLEFDYLIREGNGRQQLFDFLKDPLEQHDLAVEEPAAPRIQRNARELDRILQGESVQ